ALLLRPALPGEVPAQRPENRLVQRGRIVGRVLLLGIGERRPGPQLVLPAGFGALGIGISGRWRPIDAAAGGARAGMAALGHAAPARRRRPAWAQRPLRQAAQR